MKRVYHPDFYNVDLPRLEEEFGDAMQFAECLMCVDKAVREIMKDPAREGAPLMKPPLAPTYRKKKFHSVLAPQRGVTADMRLVYRCDIDNDMLYILGVGKRKPKSSDDIYEVLNPRQ